MPSSFSISHTKASSVSTSTSEAVFPKPPPSPPQTDDESKMSRPPLYTRSKTAPQLPPLLSISPISLIALPFQDPFSPIRTPCHHTHPQDQHQHQHQSLTHHITRSTSYLPSPVSPHPLSPPQKPLSWPLRRTSLASLATKSLPCLPLATIKPAHLFQRIRSSFSTFLEDRREERNKEWESEQKKKQEQKFQEDRQEEEETWGREWEMGYQGGGRDGQEGGYEYEEFGEDFYSHLPPEVSMDRSEIEYLRRLEREALSARVVGIMA